jgi:predicted alpha/beta hydrolase
MYVLGASFGPLATGMLSDHLARRAMNAAGSAAMTEQFRAVGLHHAMYMIPTLALVCALVLFAASRTVSADMGRVRHSLKPARGTPLPG